MDFLRDAGKKLLTMGFDVGKPEKPEIEIYKGKELLSRSQTPPVKVPEGWLDLPRACERTRLSTHPNSRSGVGPYAIREVLTVTVAYRR